MNPQRERWRDEGVGACGKGQDRCNLVLHDDDNAPACWLRAEMQFLLVLSTHRLVAVGGGAESCVGTGAA